MKVFGPKSFVIGEVTVSSGLTVSPEEPLSDIFRHPG